LPAYPPPQQFELLAFLTTQFAKTASADPVSATAGPLDLEGRFAGLAAAWRKDTALTSSLTEMFAHPAYQRIIGMGAAALPMIFCELANEPDYWFGALQAITGCDPVPPARRGDLQRMAADWLAWGRTRGLAP
jgi:hypothetical protein